MTKALLLFGGFYCFAFAVFHILFWKIFRWRQDLHRLTPTNRAIMQILNLRLIYIFVVFSVISIVFQNELLSSSFGKFVTIVISVFWFMRAIEQVIFFSLKNGVSIAFFIICLFGSALYALPLIL